MASNIFISVLMGDETLLAQCGDHLLARGQAIAAVVTQSERIRQWAERAGLKTITPDEVLPEALAGIKFDWFFSIGNLRIVPNTVWQRACRGAVNFHDGPLPRYAGLNAPVWAILADEHDYGISWHFMIDKVDQGDILVSEPVEISNDDTALSLNTKCLEAGITGFQRLVAQIETDAIAPRRQNLADRTYFHRFTRPASAAALDLCKPTEDCHRLLRALDFGTGYANPLAIPKIYTPSGAFNVVGWEIDRASSGKPAGSVVSLAQDGARIATADGVLVVRSLTDAAGQPVRLTDVLVAGSTLPHLDETVATDLTALVEKLAPGEAWFTRRLRSVATIEIEGSRPAETDYRPEYAAIEVNVPASSKDQDLVAGIVAYFARTTSAENLDIALVTPALDKLVERHPGHVAPTLPFRVALPSGQDVAALKSAVSAELDELARRSAYLGDVVTRRLGGAPVRPTLALRIADSDPERPVPGSVVTFSIGSGLSSLRLVHDVSRFSADEARALADRLAILLDHFVKSSGIVADLRLMTPHDEHAIVYGRNATARDHDRGAMVHTLVSRQAQRTPEAVALVCGEESLSYADLERRADAVAAALVTAGIGPDALVGLYLDRSIELVIGALGILKAGGAYVPLDPAYPADRIRLMIEDSKATIVLTSADLETAVPADGLRILTVEVAMAGEASVPAVAVEPRHLAYVIYTSGSTGRPKGVMVEHRNVVNFFAGMDDRIEVPADNQPVWLAVTSLSFDISVLELFWSLSRGFKVVVHKDHSRSDSRPRRRLPSNGKGMDFGLFFWGNDDGAGPRKYQLLLEGARFADTRGFRAVWTPERHFHAFGGPFPNPAVTGAAVAAITRNLDVRAGSCVLPLHHTARVAEEWAVIDNISNGRTGLAVAAGWMPEDFLLRPENAPPHNKSAMFRELEVLRRLWRGENVTFQGSAGESIDVVTQPRPVQKELPIWVTVAGNPDTYREAARVGANLLTHLLGQSIDEVAEKIKIYRDELRATGRDPAKYTVTLMLHTLVGRDRDAVRDQARGPMKAYLKSAAALIKQYAWAFPAFKKPQGVTTPSEVDLQTLSEEELDAIIEFAFLRYFDDSGLFGTVDEALARVEQVQAIGVDEIACLIDFGIASDVALAGLEPLAEVVAATNPAAADDAGEIDMSLAGQIRRHGVTHLQCTPSMAAMILLNDDDRAALADVRHMFLGGEALQSALLRDLRATTKATIENMYGPTETTIWSSTGPADQVDGSVPLGTAIANTQLYILDSRLRPLPPGLPGELFIGGDGVTRGYFDREDLTRERFLDNPFVPDTRMYRTGDLVKYSPSGSIQFLGRTDHQVKIRGYRIELGEIETRIGAHPAIAEAVVVARQDSVNDARIVAYIRFKGERIGDDELRKHVRATLPDYMVPAHFVTILKFPLTPNAKVDRKALPKPEEAVQKIAAEVEFVAPANEVQQLIAEAFRRALNVERVGTLDNFFSLGGHSLLAVQVHRELKKTVSPSLTITDIYRFPTIAGLSSHILDRGQASNQLGRIADRAQSRRQAMTARRAR